MDNLDKEQQKLADLEFDYYIARISKQDKEIITLAKSKYTRQLNKVLRIQKAQESEK